MGAVGALVWRLTMIARLMVRDFGFAQTKPSGYNNIEQINGNRWFKHKNFRDKTTIHTLLVDARQGQPLFRDYVVPFQDAAQWCRSV